MLKRILEYIRQRKAIKYAAINANADFLVSLGRAYSEVVRRELNEGNKNA